MVPPPIKKCCWSEPLKSREYPTKLKPVLESRKPKFHILAGIGFFSCAMREPNKNKVGKLGRAELEEIAKTKMPDLSAYDMDQAVKIIAGSARSMGIETEGV